MGLRPDGERPRELEFAFAVAFALGAKDKVEDARSRIPDEVAVVVPVMVVLLVDGTVLGEMPEPNSSVMALCGSSTVKVVECVSWRTEIGRGVDTRGRRNID